MTTDTFLVTGQWFCNNHKPVNICECGMNNVCRTCGIGSGAAPCDCTPLPKIEILFERSKIIMGEKVIANGL